MKAVADELHRQAIASSSPTAEMFARSAYNRCYYACYHIARNTIEALLGPAQAQSPHQTIPIILEDILVRKVKEHVKRVQWGGGSQLESRKATFMQLAADAASTLRRSHNLRVLADYRLEEPVHRSQGNAIALGNVSFAAARNWVDIVDRNCGQLQKIWKELGI